MVEHILYTIAISNQRNQDKDKLLELFLLMVQIKRQINNNSLTTATTKRTNFQQSKIKLTSLRISVQASINERDWQIKTKRKQLICLN
jgi:hypothetical protein